ncbi:hypothetical protein AMTRI_Chr10g229010 [Amborella trichopoda]|uniref:Tyrosine-protein phosphatase domain-containing protein n=1 Tax=Amborella trichopoda TaxID=13333 RepID=W1P1V1_AMBTC|nr:protein-tyrosine-phosphatase IBR5 [Amborella trichopoda]ERN01609.1 hypothetical protein AMTR_s00090p00042810 [Amborella trichopoda]|eukprot:XP_020520279.1 protein-tyrosine-phosphatase IBR5 [Amborella trichopoda]
MRKRERENPCGICGHYHKYEEGEVCGVCGHRIQATLEKPSHQFSAFPTEILPEFLFLGSYDNASRAELLKTQGITRIINTVPACQNLYKNSFTYYCLKEDKTLAFDDAIELIEQVEKERERVLVHCMSGQNRSPAIVIAYLMKCKRWRLAQSYQWVKDRRPSVNLSPAVYEQLQDYERKVFGSNESNPITVFPSPEIASSFGFGFQAPSADQVLFPKFNVPSSTSIFDSGSLNMPPQSFTFAAGKDEKVPHNPFGVTPPNGANAPMDSS